MNKADLVLFINIFVEFEKFFELEKCYRVSDEAKNDPFLGGHLSPNPNLFDQILP